MSIYVRHLGQGPRACLALHCSLAHSGAWRGISEQLDDTLSLTAPDFPGHGKTTLTLDGDDQADRAIEVAASCLMGPVDILGHSFGGYTALRLAMRFPEKVKSLWLYEPVFMAAARESHPELHAQNRAEMVEVNALLEAGDNLGAARFFVRIWGDGSRWNDLPPETQDYFAKRVVQPNRLQPWLADDVSNSLPELANIKVPVTIVYGTATAHPIMPEVCKNLVARLPNARLAQVAGAGHMGPISHAVACADLITSHFASL